MRGTLTKRILQTTTLCILAGLLSLPLAGCTLSELEMVAHDGETRTYWINTRGAQGGGSPLVLVLHGGNGTGQRIERQTGFSWIAEAEGFIVAYPNGIDKQWNDGRVGGPAGGQDDVGFIAAVLDDITAKHGFDPKRVYVAGASNGGMMALRLACELSDRIAAVAPVIASMPADMAGQCAPGEPVAMLFVNGTEDGLVPYEGGQVGPGNRGTVMPVEESVALWTALNGCPETPETYEFPDIAPFDGTLLEADVYSPCAQGTEVLLYRVVGGGHTWPGGIGGALVERQLGNISKEMAASQVIWEFFKLHPKP